MIDFTPETHELRNGDQLAYPPLRTNKAEYNDAALVGICLRSDGTAYQEFWHISGNWMETEESEFDIVIKHPEYVKYCFANPKRAKLMFYESLGVCAQRRDDMAPDERLIRVFVKGDVTKSEFVDES